LSTGRHFIAPLQGLNGIIGPLTQGDAGDALGWNFSALQADPDPSRS